jgi:hypothetical protein
LKKYSNAHMHLRSVSDLSTLLGAEVCLFFIVLLLSELKNCANLDDPMDQSDTPGLLLIKSVAV